MQLCAFFFKDSLVDLSAAKEPYILVHDDQDSGDEDPKSMYSIMIGEELFCKVPKTDNALGHCLIQLTALYYIST